MRLPLRDLRIRAALLVMSSIFLILFDGCGWLSRAPKAEKKLKSTNQMKELLVGVMLYRESHDHVWPEELAQVREFVELDLDELLHNPITGDNPGYEYVKPPQDADPETTVILYQVRDGLRDTSLSVGFANNRVSTFGSQE